MPQDDGTPRIAAVHDHRSSGPARPDGTVTPGQRRHSRRRLRIASLGRHRHRESLTLANDRVALGLDLRDLVLVGVVVLTPWNQWESTRCHADRRPMCAPNNIQCAPSSCNDTVERFSRSKSRPRRPALQALGFLVLVPRFYRSIYQRAESRTPMPCSGGRLPPSVSYRRASADSWNAPPPPDLSPARRQPRLNSRPVSESPKPISGIGREPAAPGR